MENTNERNFDPWLDAFKKEELIDALNQKTPIKRGDRDIPLSTIMAELGRKKETDASF